MPDGKAQIEIGELGKPHGCWGNVTKSLPLLGSAYRLGINVFTDIGYDQHVKNRFANSATHRKVRLSR